VADLEKELITADFMIVPPGYPTGVRTKIPEAFAWGLPVVTGYNDAFGAGLKQGDAGVIIADSPDEYVSACLKLINNTLERNKISCDALGSWSGKYDQVSITKAVASGIASTFG